MLKKIFMIMMVLFSLTLWSCSGSRNEGPEIIPFQNTELQNQVDDLLDKIENNPSNPAYRRELAHLYNENNRSNDALMVLEAGLKVDPNDSETRYLYAEIAEQKGDKRKAYTSYKEILQGTDGNDYLDRIAPKFVDVFAVSKVVNSAANEAFGSFSGDGGKIVYQSDENGNWDLYEYTFSTSRSEELV